MPRLISALAAAVLAVAVVAALSGVFLATERSPSASTEPPTSDGVASTAATDPETEVHRQLIAPGQCGTGGDVFLPSTSDVREKVEAAGGDGWIEQGAIFVGTLAEAVTAFEGTLIGEKDGSAWIIVMSESGKQRGLELRLVMTVPNGDVWMAANTVEEIPCDQTVPDW